MVAVASHSAIARRIARDTAYPQRQKGTETAHGTNHRVTNERYTVAFATRFGAVKFIKKAKVYVCPRKRLDLLPTLKQSRPTRRLHNTNMQGPRSMRGLGGFK